MIHVTNVYTRKKLKHDKNVDISASFCYNPAQKSIIMAESPLDSTPAAALAKFKQEVRDWLKTNQISVTEMATQIGKSEGTVRNWLYSTLNITDENQKAIRTFIRKVNAGEYTSNGLVNAYAKTGFVIISIASDEFSPDDLAYWCLAAGVPVNTLSVHPQNPSINADEVTILANWVTTSVMSRTREVLLHAIGHHTYGQRDNRFKIEKYMKESLLKDVTPMGFKQVPHDIYLEDDGSRCLPVIITDWKALYLTAAADICGECHSEFIAKSLRESAGKANMQALNDFLYPKNQDDEDDLPF